MGIAEMHSLLSGTGFPVAYSHFKTPQKLPYICYTTPDESGFAADGVRYYAVNRYRIELYTETRYLSAESELERALSGFFYTKSSVWIPDEQCFMTVYELEG